jgi:hypothetical protein
MSDKKPGAPAAPMGYVRMGTASSGYEKQVAKEHADADRRRAYQDQQYAIARERPDEAVLRVCSLGGKSTHATVILALWVPVGEEIKQFMTCEITDQGNELALVVMCVPCVFKHGRRAADSQITIKQSNRKWWLVPYQEGQEQSTLPKWARGNRIWINPEDPNEVLPIPGTVHMHEKGVCPVCRWKFVIDDAVLRTV